MCFASFSFETPSLSLTKYFSISFVLAFILEIAIEITGTESQGWFHCHIFAFIFIGWVHRPHKTHKAFLVFAEHPVTTFKTG